MTNREKALQIFAEALQAEVQSISETSRLEELSEWCSIVFLHVIFNLEEVFSIDTGEYLERLNEAETIGAFLDVLGIQS
jgi:acyl carrier protein